MQIYKITNLINGKIYIGKDTFNDKNYFGSGVLIKRAINKFGVDNFKKEILEECKTNEELCEREKYWIRHLNTTNLTIGYNITYGGDGGDTISNNPKRDEIINKISNKMKNKEFTEEHKKKLSENHYSTKYRKGKNYVEIYGYDKSQEYKSKLIESRKKYKNQKERLGEKYENYVNNLQKRFRGENNPMKKNKYIWCHNVNSGKQIRIIENSEIPENFAIGRKNTSKK